MLDDGVDVVLGSDAPVSPLDPWLAIATAVHRAADGDEPWHPEQAITAREALAASTDGWGTVAVGHRADLVLLDADPLAGDDGPAQPRACGDDGGPRPRDLGRGAGQRLSRPRRDLTTRSDMQGCAARDGDRRQARRPRS